MNNLFLVFTILVALSFNFISKYTTYKSVTLKDHHFLGFSIAIPDWKVKEQLNLANSGKYILHDPLGDDRFFRIDWQHTKAPIMETYSGSVNAVLKEVPSNYRTANNKRFRIYRFEDKAADKRLAISELFCEKLNLSVTLSSFLNTDWETNIDLLSKVYASIKCDSKPVKFEVLYPKVTPPSGFRRVDLKNDVLTYANETGDTLVFSGASTLNRKLENKEGKAIQKIFASILSKLGMTISEDFKRQGNRYFSHGTLKIKSGETTQAAIVILLCPEQHYSFNGLYISEKFLLSESYSRLKAVNCPDSGRASSPPIQ